MNPLLASFLEPLYFFLETENLMELSVLKEKEIVLEIEGKGYVFMEAEGLDYTYWKNLCHILANMNNLVFDPEKSPILSTSLPDLKNEKFHRFEAMISSHVSDKISVSIRLNRDVTRSLKDFGIEGPLFERIRSVIHSGKAILISGGTSSGKTTLLNLLGQLVPLHKRILTLEDTRELNLPHKNWKAYVVPRNETNGTVTYQAIIDHFMRSRPDIVMTGEVSLLNSFPIMRLLNTGHRGFMCTIHANSPKLALEKAFEQNLHLGGNPITGMSSFLKQVIDLVIQVDHMETTQRKMTRMWMPKVEEFIECC